MTSVQRQCHITSLCSPPKVFPMAKQQLLYTKVMRIYTFLQTLWPVLTAGNYQTLTAAYQSTAQRQKQQVWNFKLTRKPLGPLVPAGPVAPGGPWQTKEKGEEEEKRGGKGKREREIKQRFTLTEHRAPWLLTLGGSLTSGTHYGVCC